MITKLMDHCATHQGTCLGIIHCLLILVPHLGMVK